MTVKELIEKLKEFDENLEVRVVESEFGSGCLVSVSNAEKKNYCPEDGDFIIIE